MLKTFFGRFISLVQPDKQERAILQRASSVSLESSSVWLMKIVTLSGSCCFHPQPKDCWRAWSQCTVNTLSLLIKSSPCSETHWGEEALIIAVNKKWVFRILHTDRGRERENQLWRMKSVVPPLK